MKLRRTMAVLFSALFLGVAIALLAPPIPDAEATTCFKSGEEISGMNKICYYNCLGSTVAINVRSTELCPLTIRR